MRAAEARVVVFGEGMVEERADGALAWGGDAINTALYLAREGARPELLTAMGADPACEAIVAAWASEGIGVGHVLRDPARTAGRYRIEVAPTGERSFVYERDASAARGLFELEGAEAALAWAVRADVLYLTGITLSIFGPAGRRRVEALARAVRSRGGHVVFDPNFRPAGWPSPASAWAAIQALGAAITLAMPSLEDHERLTGSASPERAAGAWLALGAREVVVKLGDQGALAVAAAQRVRVPAAPPIRVVDTTAAGDAFNAAYIAARLLRRAPIDEALRRGAELAAEVVAWPGAIAPRLDRDVAAKKTD